MALAPPDMEKCCKKKRCRPGTVNEGQVYDTCEPCPEGSKFNEQTCDCEVIYFIEYAWSQLVQELSTIAENDCEEQFLDPQDNKIVITSNTGVKDVDPEGLFWTVFQSGVPVCSTSGTGACSTDSGFNEDGFVSFPQGNVTSSVELARATCFGSGATNSNFRQTFFEVGVTTGYGATLQEAECDAKNKDPELGIFPTCS